MNKKFSLFTASLFSVLAILLTYPTGVSAYPAVGYNAAFSSLPQGQGWTFKGETDPSPHVSGGALYQGETPMDGMQYWTHSGSTAWDFTSSETFVVQAELKVVESTYDSSRLRTGYYIVGWDNNGRGFSLGVAHSSAGDHGLLLGGSTYLPLGPSGIDWGAFNTYRIEVGSGQYAVYINGLLKGGTTPVTAITGSRGVGFGDNTNFGQSQTELRYMTFGGSGAPVPVPAAIFLFAPGLAGLVALRGRMKSRRARPNPTKPAN
jgi:hypothetical protein